MEQQPPATQQLESTTGNDNNTDNNNFDFDQQHSSYGPFPNTMFVLQENGGGNNLPSITPPPHSNNGFHHQQQQQHHLQVGFQQQQHHHIIPHHHGNLGPTVVAGNGKSSFGKINSRTEIDPVKLEKKRERNRIAATKCRQRKLEKISTLGNACIFKSREI